MRGRNILRIMLGFATLQLAMPNLASAQAVTGWTEKQAAHRTELFARLTAEHFDKTSTLKDDDLETVATITTAPGFTFKGGFTDRVRADSFLRAFIEKTTGRTSYQLYATITYTGQWRTFESGTFSTPAGPVSQPLTVIDHSVTCPYSICVYTEVVALELTESFLRQLAQRADERPVTPWRFRFKAKDSEDWTDDIAPAEAAGLLLAVDRYRTAHRLP